MHKHTFLATNGLHFGAPLSCTHWYNVFPGALRASTCLHLYCFAQRACSWALCVATMFARVRFVEDFADNTLQVIPVDDIEDFHPKNDTDFDGKAYWNDEKNDTSSGCFIVQILRLAGKLRLFYQLNQFFLTLYSCIAKRTGFILTGLRDLARKCGRARLSLFVTPNTDFSRGNCCKSEITSPA